MTVKDFMVAKTWYYKNDKKCVAKEDDIIDHIEVSDDCLLVFLCENVGDMTVNELHERCVGDCLDCSLVKQCPFANYIDYLKPYKWEV